MARMIDFPESNFVWKGWPADPEEGRIEVGDLPSYRDPEWQPNGLTISCWKLTWRELLRVLFRGKIWLHVHGPQPPVFIGADYPFVRRPGFFRILWHRIKLVRRLISPRASQAAAGFSKGV